jgi:hypothetical protein
VRAWLIPVSVSVAVLAVAGCLCAALLSLRADLVCLPDMLATFQGAALARVDRLRVTLDALPDRLVPPVLAATVGEVRHAADGVLAEARVFRGSAEAQTAAALSIVDRRSGEALAEVGAARAALTPPVTAATALVADLNASWDDLYPDIRGSVASATVAITSTARASEAVRDAAPQVAASVVGIGQSSAAIAADVRREVDAATLPKHWWQKLFGPLYAAGRLAGAIL